MPTKHALEENVIWADSTYYHQLMLEGSGHSRSGDGGHPLQAWEVERCAHFVVLAQENKAHTLAKRRETYYEALAFWCGE